MWHVCNESLYMRASFCPPHHITEELSRSHISHFGILSRYSVQSEAVQARIQLFHLFTQEPLIFSKLYAQNHLTHFMHQRLSLTAAV